MTTVQVCPDLRCRPEDIEPCCNNPIEELTNLGKTSITSHEFSAAATPASLSADSLLQDDTIESHKTISAWNF